MPINRFAPGWRISFTLLLALSGVASTAIAETCAPEPQGEGSIAGVIDARTVRLEDGRQVRLAGLAAIADMQAAETLLSRHVGRTVSLHSDNDAPDRYGRQHAVLFPAPSDTSLQVTLLAAGAAIYDGNFGGPGCKQEFTAAEASARRARMGLWGENSAHLPNAENPTDILDRVGQFVVVEGQVRSVRQAGGTNYLNFSRRWTQGFSVTIPSRSLSAFEAAGVSPSKLEGQRILVRGFVDVRTGPRIEATRPTQIEWAGTNAAGTTIGIRN